MIPLRELTIHIFIFLDVSEIQLMLMTKFGDKNVERSPISHCPVTNIIVASALVSTRSKDILSLWVLSGRDVHRLTLMHISRVRTVAVILKYQESEQTPAKISITGTAKNIFLNTEISEKYIKLYSGHLGWDSSNCGTDDPVLNFKNEPNKYVDYQTPLSPPSTWSQGNS